MSLKGHFMLHLTANLRFHFREHLKTHKYVKKKMHFTLQLMIHLTVQSRAANEGTFNGAPMDALTRFLFYKQLHF